MAGSPPEGAPTRSAPHYQERHSKTATRCARPMPINMITINCRIVAPPKRMMQHQTGVQLRGRRAMHSLQQLRLIIVS